MNPRRRVIRRNRLWTRPTAVIGLLFLLAATVVAIIGQLSTRQQLDIHSFFGDFYTNISTDLVSIAVTVLIIDTLNQRRADAERKRQRIREMRSPDNGIALAALNELRDEGWADDGSLRDAYLLAANLEGAFLREVDLSGAWLRDANLQRAYMRDANLANATLIGANLSGVRELTLAQLRQASALLGATLPDGSRYDGCLHLRGDEEIAQSRGYDLTQLEEMARFYGVPLRHYFDIGWMDSMGEAILSAGIYKEEDWLASYLTPNSSAQERIVPFTSLQRESDSTAPTTMPRGFIMLAFIAVGGVLIGWLLGQRFR